MQMFAQNRKTVSRATPVARVVSRDVSTRALSIMTILSAVLLGLVIIVISPDMGGVPG